MLRDPDLDEGGDEDDTTFYTDDWEDVNGPEDVNIWEPEEEEDDA